MASPAPSPRSSPWGLPLTRLLVLLAIALAIVTGVLALTQPAQSHPPPSEALTVHMDLGAVLGVVILGAFISCLLLRRKEPKALPWSLAALVLVVIMGGIGAGLASGALPVDFVLLQTGLLGVLLVLLLMLLGQLWPRPEKPPTPEETPAEPPTT